MPKLALVSLAVAVSIAAYTPSYATNINIHKTLVSAGPTIKNYAWDKVNVKAHNNSGTIEQVMDAESMYAVPLNGEVYLTLSDRFANVFYNNMVESCATVKIYESPYHAYWYYAEIDKSSC